MSEDNQAIVRSFFETLWNTKNADAVDDLMESNCDGDFIKVLPPALPPSPPDAFSATKHPGTSVTTRLEEMANTHPEIARRIIERNRNFRGVIKRSVGRYRESVPDVQFKIEEMVAEGGMVWTRWTLRSSDKAHSHKVSISILTGKPVAVTGVNISRIAEGKIQDYRSYIVFEVIKVLFGWYTF